MRLILLVVTWLLGAVPAVAQIELNARVDRNEISLGERVVLTVELIRAQNVGPPDLGDLGQFQVQYLGPSTQVSIVNGQITARSSHVYALTPREAGRFTIGPFRVEVGGRSYEAPPIALLVTAAPATGGTGTAPANKEVWLEVRPARTDVFLGERIPVVIKLYVGQARVDQVQYPRLPADGYTVEGLSQPRQADEIVGDRRVRSVQFETAVTPVRPGEFVLAPTMDMTVVEGRRRGGLGSAFDDFFGGAFGERRPLQVAAEPVTLTVHPLPEAGRPPDFSGAIGQFDFTLEVKPTELNAGDPITVQSRIEGSGNLATLQPPVMPAGERFRTYPPQAVKGEDQARARAFEQVVIPRAAGIDELPAVRFSYFDPVARSYRTITRGPVPLTVRAAPAGAEPQVIGQDPAAAPSPAAETLGRDIVYIKDTPARFRARGDALYRRPWFIVVQMVPVGAYVVLAVWRRRRDRLAADPRLARFRQAGREAKHALGALARPTADARRFYDELAAAVNSYLAAKLDLPPGAIESERVLSRLRRPAAPDDVRREVASFFALIERARYAPAAAGTSEREAALALAERIVALLERQRGLLDTLRAAVMLATLAGGLAAALGAAAADAPADPHTTFFEGNAAYRAGRYDDAARAYERVLAAGLEDGALLFNLGNAHVKAGHLGPAILSYERARELLPRDADVGANLAYARELAEEPGPEPSWWERLAFPLATRATASELAVTLAILWWAFWALLAARLLVARAASALGRAASLAAILAVLVAASLAARVTGYDFRRPAIVTAEGETVVRFEPSVTGTEHFRLGAGAWVDVTDRREGWVQIRRADGRRGWVPAEGVGEL